jgi:hypothetical protein
MLAVKQRCNGSSFSNNSLTVITGDTIEASFHLSNSFTNKGAVKFILFSFSFLYFFSNKGGQNSWLMTRRHPFLANQCVHSLSNNPVKSLAVLALRPVLTLGVVSPEG